MATVSHNPFKPIGSLFACFGKCCSDEVSEEPLPVQNDPYIVDGIPFQTDLFQLDGDPPTSEKNKFFLVLNTTLKKIIHENIKDLMYRLQDPLDGLPIRTVKRLFTVVPAVFTGIDLIMWIVDEMRVDIDHALYFANLLSSHGYLFSIDYHNLKVKNDGGFYRLQCPYYWQCGTANSKDRDYAVYLCKRVSDKGELTKHEGKQYEKLRKVFKNRWKLIEMQADTELDAIKLQQTPNNQLIMLSRERAFWDFHKPAPGVKVKREFNLEKLKKFDGFLPC